MTEESHQDDLTALRFVTLLLRNRQRVVASGVVVAVLVMVVSLVIPRTFTATGAFVPHSAEPAVSRLADLASQFGFPLPPAQVETSPAFYATVLKSRQLLGQVVTSTYDVGGPDQEGDGGRLTLVEQYGLELDSGVDVEEAVDRLSGELVVTVRRETGIVELRHTSRSPSLASQVATRLLSLINEFNLETRQSQAAAERAFIEDRLSQAEQELQQVEGRLQVFLRDNRRYENSPELQFEHDRLQRRVALHQQVVVSLAQAHEEARIDEVRNTPVITVVEQPVRPARPDSRSLPTKAVLGFLLGLVLGVLGIVSVDLAARGKRQQPLEFADFEQARQETAEGLVRGWTRIRSGLPGSRRG